MDKRRCQSCGEEKSISGVWYLLANQTGTFVCGTCFHEAPQAGHSVAAK